MNDDILDLIIIGGGPCGLAAGIEAKNRGLRYLIIEKGTIAESVRRYPQQMTFFSTSDNLSIGGIPFPTVGPKPTRVEALQYYRKVAEYYGLDVHLYENVEYVQQQEDGVFPVKTSKTIYRAKHVILATGYFDIPRRLNIPGEDLPQVSHYYDEAFRYVHQKVVIVGGGNSAVETALDLYRHQADVTMILRGETFKKTAKYWLVPDLENRIKEGSIAVMKNYQIKEIEPRHVVATDLNSGQDETIPADFVLLLTGYLPDLDLFRDTGIRFDEDTLDPVMNPETFETNVPGLYLAGTATCGVRTEKVFVENGRYHGKAIIDDILGA